MFPCANCSKRQVQCFFVSATGKLPEVSSKATEQRIDNRKRKLDDVIGHADAPGQTGELSTTSDGVNHDQTHRTAAYPAALSSSAPYSPARAARVLQSAAHLQQEQQRYRDSLLNMNTSVSAHVDQNTGDEASDETDEAELQGMSRMLDDGKGRMRMFSFEQECTFDY